MTADQADVAAQRLMTQRMMTQGLPAQGHPPVTASPVAGPPVTAPPVTVPDKALALKHILVVGINYAPEPTGIAPYTTDLAEHLARGAASVAVIAGLPCYPTWRVEPEYRGRRRFTETVNGVSLTRLKHVVPGKQDALRRGAYEASFLMHASAARVKQRPDIVVGITPALGGAVAAARLAKKYDAKLVLVVQDLMGRAAAQSGIAGGGKVAGIASGMEAWALRQADRIVVVADAFRVQLEEYGIDQARVHTVGNWSHVTAPSQDRAAVRAKLGWAPDVTVALHTGNMGLKQDLGNIIEAARLTQHRTDLRWVLMGDGSQRAELEAQAAGLENLEFLPPCESGDYPELLGAADVLLLNERASCDDMSLPSKLTSYFMSGRPVAAAVPPNGASADELARAGAPLPAAAGEPLELVALVSRLGASPAVCASHGADARAYADANLTLRGAMLKMDAILLA